MHSGRRNSVSLGGRQIKKDITTSDPKRTKFRIIDLRVPSLRFRVKCPVTLTGSDSAGSKVAERAG